MHQFTWHRDWCITHMANTANTASVQVINQGFAIRNKEKENVYMQQGDRKRSQSECLIFFSKSFICHPFSLQSLCAHKNIYIYRFQDRQGHWAPNSEACGAKVASLLHCSHFFFTRWQCLNECQGIFQTHCFTALDTSLQKQTGRCVVLRMHSCYSPLPLRTCNNNGHLCTKNCTSATCNCCRKRSIGSGCFL